MASHPAAHTYYAQRHREHEESGVLLKLLVVFLGLGVAVLGLVAIWMGASAQNARNDARAAASAAAKRAADTTSMPGMAMPAAGEGARPTPSFAGIAPANAAELPATTTGPVVNVHLGINHRVLSIAPGIKYEAWTFGTGVPGPVIHARQGQTVHVTLTNNAPMAHSVDFHAARIAPDKAFVDILPGKSFTFSFKVDDPGVYMYHCGTKPVLAHIANGMYGAIVVDPANANLLPPVHHAYVLVSGEWYLNAPGDRQPAALDLVKAHQMTPDWVTWNGYAAQYVKHPLTAHPGHTVRFYVVDAGPSIDTDFHVVGTVLERAWLDAAVTDPPLHNIQTATVPAGGGGIFDVSITKPGLYPFVTHSFASVDTGAVGLLNVGDVGGTMSH
jgi:nitrite reductase (NO-forming)